MEELDRGVGGRGGVGGWGWGGGRLVGNGWISGGGEKISKKYKTHRRHRNQKRSPEKQRLGERGGRRETLCLGGGGEKHGGVRGGEGGKRGKPLTGARAGDPVGGGVKKTKELVTSISHRGGKISRGGGGVNKKSTLKQEGGGLDRGRGRGKKKEETRKIKL